jgi:hypothetical protein
MTWTYKLTDSENLTVYDHTGSQITVVQNDGSGIRLPGDVEEVMAEEVLSRDVDSLSKWQKATIIDLAGTDIEEREG